MPQGLSDNTHPHRCYQYLHYSAPHTLWGCAVESSLVLTAATILADAAVTPPSLKWPEMCRMGC